MITVSRLLLLFLAFAVVGSIVSCSPTRNIPEERYIAPPPQDPEPVKEQPVAIVPPPPPPVVEAPSSAKAFIILDPGHGGEDYGTHSTKPFKYQEKVLTLSTVKMLKTYLEELGYVVQMTRSDDVFVALDKRAIFANNRHPKIFVSVHYNSAPSKSADGIEIFYYRSEEEKSRSQASKALASAILKRMIENTQANSRGVKHGNLAVIRETDMPAVLIEGGFLTNEEEMYKLKDANYLKKLAWGIAQGIEDYLSKE